jgi:hypothetical protein
MKNLVSLFLIAIFISFYSCTDDTGTINVTYYEAIALYGDLDKIRDQMVNEDPRQIDNPGKIYVANDLILIGEETFGIHVIDNSNPEVPIAINFMNVPGNREYFVKGDFLYAESYYDIIKFDISDPYNVIELERVINVFNDELKNSAGETLLGFNFIEVTKEVDQNSNLYDEIRTQENILYLDFARNTIPRSAVPASFAGNSNQSIGTVNRITHHKEHLYVLGRYDLTVISDHSSFEQVRQLKNIGEEMETIFPFKENLFIGSRASMEIFSIDNPEHPVHKFRFEHATSCDPVLPYKNAAYISLRTADFSPCPGNTNAVIVLDIQNFNNPKETEEISMRSPYGMAVINNLLYVGEGENGLSIYDATDPLHPTKALYDASIKAYDIIEHPTRHDILLIAGPNGLDQYQIDPASGMQLESRILF